MSPEENPTANDAQENTAEDEPVEAQLAEVASNNSDMEATIDSTIASASSDFEKDNSITDFFVSGTPAAAVAGAKLAGDGVPAFRAPPPLAKSLQNLSANGGAVGAFVLGLWCLLGSFITNWSIINGLLGLVLGFWGLTSRKQRMAWIGIGLCLVGVFFSLANISEMVNEWWNVVDENDVGL